MGFVGLLAIAGLAWGFARVLDAPPWAGRAILLAVVVIAALSQILLPPGAPFRESAGGAIRALLWLAVAAVPILGYRWVLGRLRQRSQPGTAQVTEHPTGFVLIEDDAALMQDILARIVAETPGAAPRDQTTFSVAHRGADGGITGAGQAVLDQGMAEFRNFWLDPAQRDGDLGERLLEALEDEARRRGATRAALDTLDRMGAEAVFAEAGYKVLARVEYPTGPVRILMTKDLI